MDRDMKSFFIIFYPGRFKKIKKLFYDKKGLCIMKPKSLLNQYKNPNEDE